MDTLICENCGYEENTYGQKACSNCGHKLFYINEDTDFDNVESQKTSDNYNSIPNHIKENDEYWDKINSCKLTTGYNFEGYKIVEYYDVIFEESFIGIGFGTHLKAIGDLFAQLTGDEFKAITHRLKEVKAIVRQKLIKDAISLGANAIIGIDFESSNLIGDTILVSMTGTAVKIEKIIE